jgi:hypothetical protein
MWKLPEVPIIYRNILHGLHGDVVKGPTGPIIGEVRPMINRLKGLGLRVTIPGIEKRIKIIFMD